MGSERSLLLLAARRGLRAAAAGRGRAHCSHQGLCIQRRPARALLPVRKHNAAQRPQHKDAPLLPGISSVEPRAARRAPAAQLSGEEQEACQVGWQPPGEGAQQAPGQQQLCIQAPLWVRGKAAGEACQLCAVLLRQLPGHGGAARGHSQQLREEASCAQAGGHLLQPRSAHVSGRVPEQQQHARGAGAWVQGAGCAGRGARGKRCLQGEGGRQAAALHFGGKWRVASGWCRGWCASSQDNVDHRVAGPSLWAQA
jgi:hypothetical protein